MSELTPELSSALGRYQQEVVRWNKQINLVSRKDTLARVADLIQQCRSALGQLVQADLSDWDTGKPLRYYDLGSGGGLPGFVWHQVLAERFDQVETQLVEPREKRAWFLERLSSITPERPLGVRCGRWGEIEAGSQGPDGPKVGPSNVLVSLKALRLSDPVVLAGLSRVSGADDFGGGARVTIARFYPPEQRWGRGLASDLKFASEPVEISGVTYRPLERAVLGPKAPTPTSAALVVCSYEVEL